MKKRLGCLAAASLLATLICASSARAVVTNYTVTMDGPSESPTNASPATGTGTVAYDNVAHTLTLTASYSGLLAGVTQTHFHAATTASGLAGVANPTAAQRQAAAAAALTAGIAIGNSTLPGFTLNNTSGTYNQVLDLTQAAIYNATYLSGNGGTAAGAEAAFASALSSGRTYWNIHTASPNGFPGGEIRGFPVAVPEPGTVGLASIAALALLRRRRK